MHVTENDIQHALNIGKWKCAQVFRRNGITNSSVMDDLVSDINYGIARAAFNWKANRKSLFTDYATRYMDGRVKTWLKNYYANRTLGIEWGVSADEILDEIPDYSAIPDEVDHNMRRWLSSLTPTELRVVIKHYWQGKNFREISSEEHKTKQYANNTHDRAIAKLRRMALCVEGEPSGLDPVN